MILHHKKIVLLFVVFVSVFFLFFSTPANAKSLCFFNDVKTSSWFYDNVYRISSDGYMLGYSDNAFAPNDQLTRAMFVTILGRLSNIDVDSYLDETGFEDVSVDTWYTRYVSWAHEVELVYGTDNTHFEPNAPISREQLATMVARYVNNTGIELPILEYPTQFIDADAVNDWAVDSVEFMRLTGIINGDQNHYFHPQDTATRAEVATILCRLIDALGVQESISRHYLPDMTYITHAAGNIEGYSGTNSHEALQQAYSQGCRTIELDFNFTSDGQLACIHDWSTYFSPQIANNVAPSLADFLEMRIFNRFTPIDLDYVAEFLYVHPTVFIVTDIKEKNIEALSVIMNRYPDLANRFIVQIYSPNEYDPVASLGFENIILTLYQLPWSSKIDTYQHSVFASTHELVGITFDSTLCVKPGFIDGMLQSGVPLFTHTVNSISSQEAFFALGISGIYTDNLQ